MNSRDPSPHDDENLNTLSEKEKKYLIKSVGKTYYLDDDKSCTVQSVNLDEQTVTCSINGVTTIIPISGLRDILTTSGSSKSRKHLSRKRKGKKSYKKRKYGKSKKSRRLRRSVKSRR